MSSTFTLITDDGTLDNKGMCQEYVTEETVMFHFDPAIDGAKHLYKASDGYYIDLLDDTFGMGPYGDEVGPFYSLDAALAHQAWSDTGAYVKALRASWE